MDELNFESYDSLIKFKSNHGEIVEPSYTPDFAEICDLINSNEIELTDII